MHWVGRAAKSALSQLTWALVADVLISELSA
jgi:hypothetical protein